MTHRAAVVAFLDRFCAADIEGLEPLFHRNLKVSGPFVQCASRAAYLETLRADPPERCRYRIRSIHETVSTVSVLYDYQKPRSIVTIEQRFCFVGERIAEMELAFDTAGIS